MQFGLTPDLRWTCRPAELIAAAATAGFDAVSVHADRVDPETIDAYRRTGLRCPDVLALVVDDDERRILTAAEELSERARRTGADWVLTTFTVVPPERVLRRCAAALDAAGVGMAVEFSPLGPIATLADGLRMLSIAGGSARAGLVVDSWHYCFGAGAFRDTAGAADSAFSALASVPPADIAFVQFTDALPPESDRLLRETLHRRALPGEGVLALARFAGTLRERGFDGLVNAEVLSAALRDLAPVELARRLFESTVRYWR